MGNPVVHSHRSALAAQLLTMAFATHNRYDPNSQDSNPRLFACMQMYGDALTIPVPDVDRTDNLLILGANPATSNGSQMGLGNARERFATIRDRGGKIVLIDPRRTESAAWATSHHFVRPGGDAALLMAILHVLFAEHRVNVHDIAVSGLDVLAGIAARFPPERVAPAVGIDPATIRAIARDFADAKAACAYARVGVCQNAFGPVASWLVEALNVVTGNLDRAGGAMFGTPAADIGRVGRLVVGNAFGRWRSRVRGLPEFLGALPSAALSEEIETAGEGQIKALVVLAGNPGSSTPNGERLARALATLEHVVGIDFYVNETTRFAKVILPPRHLFETGNYDVLLSRFAVRNVAKYNPPIVTTGDDLRDDWEIATEVALRVRAPGLLQGVARACARGLPERAIDLLLRTGPYGLSLAKLKDAPHGLDLGPLVPAGAAGIRTRDRVVQLAPEPLVADVERLERWVDDVRQDGLVLIGRRHVRSNNSWMHNARSLTNGTDRSQLMMHPEDAAERGLIDGSDVRVTSRVGAVTVRLLASTDLMRGVVSLPHGFGHQAVADTLKVAGALAGVSANVLTDDQSVEPVVGTSILNGVPVSVERIATEGPTQPP